MKNPRLKGSGLKKLAALASLVAVSTGLTACVSTKDPYALVPCPYVGVLDDASEITRFKYGGGRDVSDIDFHGEISRIDFTCTKPENKNFVVGKAVVYTEFERGMSTTLDRQFFKIFLAISERDERIVDKSEMLVDVRFKEGSRKADARTVIRGIRIPTDGTVGADFHNIYVGFQLSPAEVAYNRTKKKS